MVAGRGRKVVIFYSNDCMGICLGGLSTCHLDEWTSYRCGHLRRCDCNTLSFNKSDISVNLPWC